MPGIDESRTFVPLTIAVLTVSDTRSLADDRSGTVLAEKLSAAGHVLHSRNLVRDDQPAIEAELRRLLEDERVQVILTTGGTGITGRDVTPEAVHSVADKEIPGFGELFRQLSYALIGTSTIQSRALGAVARGKYVFALPGSPGACRDAWDLILGQQLDSRYRPCNFAELLPRLGEQ
ncbi:MAG: molybdenum cofactor biosynthesis protein B [Myxococcales bacterium]